MIRLSIQARQALAKLGVPLFFTASLVVMLVGRADDHLASQVRMWLADRLSPLYATLAEPAERIGRVGEDLLGIIDLATENRRLRAENARLVRWYEVALALEAENATLKENLRWIPEPAPSYVTGRVVADAGGVYSRAVLIYVGPNSPVHKGQIALDAAGLVGRVTEVGRRSARVLLITDSSSRIPVELSGSHATAIMAGNNGRWPTLLYLPDGVHPTNGERVLTSSEANAFPSGLPVGTVERKGGAYDVVPSADLEELSIVRLFDYKLGTIQPPEAPGHAFPSGAAAPAAAPAAPAGE
jgi:rod shape-determining protein MreC